MQAVEAGAHASQASSDRRFVERRRRPTPMLSRYTFFGGRRAGDRRTSIGADGQYVDRYPTALAVSLVAIGLLCALDAVFTLLYMQKGGDEANPVMKALIEAAGPRNFLVFKCVVTNLGLVVLCLHKNFRFVKPVIGALLFVYSALFLYHIYLAATFA
jgi:hypothetical protein